jgi:hypothetical protein
MARRLKDPGSDSGCSPGEAAGSQCRSPAHRSQAHQCQHDIRHSLDKYKTKPMPKIPLQNSLPLEHGTVKEVTLLLREKGEDVTYHQIAKRILRKSHPETVKLAVEVSNRKKETREAKRKEIRRLIKQSQSGRKLVAVDQRTGKTKKSKTEEK